MTKKSVGIIALMGIGIGVLGSWATGCSLESGGTIGIDDDPEDTAQAAELVAPAGEEKLSAPDFLKQLDADH
jgi:hypothetical protein